MIDFEEDVPVDDVQRLQQQVQGVAEGVQQALATASKGRLLTAGLQVDIHLSPCFVLVPQVRMHKTCACTSCIQSASSADWHAILQSTLLDLLPAKHSSL